MHFLKNEYGIFNIGIDCYNIYYLICLIYILNGFETMFCSLSDESYSFALTFL